ncbi:MAG: hypothetical protein HOQ24_01975 [Mycobacteriaceae bacterium]|nr:hypothetical protein [Mycobacteriaceae bacterium]
MGFNWGDALGIALPLVGEMLGGPLGGAAGGALGTMFENLADRGWNGIDWAEVGIGAVGGLVGGALGGRFASNALKNLGKEAAAGAFKTKAYTLMYKGLPLKPWPGSPYKSLTSGLTASGLTYGATSQWQTLRGVDVAYVGDATGTDFPTYDGTKFLAVPTEVEAARKDQAIQLADSMVAAVELAGTGDLSALRLTSGSIDMPRHESGIVDADRLGEQLNLTAEQLQSGDPAVQTAVDDAKQITEQYRQEIHDLVTQFNEEARTAPADGQSVDESYAALVAGANDALEQTISAASGGDDEAADAITALTDKISELESTIGTLKSAVEESAANRFGDPVATPYLPGPPIAEPNANSAATEKLSGSSAAGRAGASPAAAASTGQPNPMAGGNSADALAPLLSMLQNDRARAGIPDDMRDRVGHSDPRAADGSGLGYAPTVPASSSGTPPRPNPAVPPAHAGATGNTANAAKPVAASTVAPTAGRGLTSDPDGGVIYVFPDGRTQRVALVVARALDVAFGNKAETNAHAAYAATTARLPEDARDAARLDPYQLVTGDVAAWDQASAIVVVFGAAAGGTLEVVVDGEMKPFIAEMTGTRTAFGNFVGFVRPQGIEITRARTNVLAEPTPSPSSGFAAVTAQPHLGAA